ncbi:MAG: hypothetical protein NZM37_09915, partial [Sandaracinaceae bacterium]|nr:hypothetical protein [Sandaracinaceae bacterium]
MFGGTPNFFSYLALLLFLPIAFLSFLFFRPIVATTWLMLGAMLYLPERVEVDPPVLPPINKQSIAALCIFIGCLVRAWARVKQAKPLRGIDFSFVLASIGFVITNLQNSDPQVFGPTHLPGTTLYDAFAGNIKDALVIYLPFLIGRAMYRSAADLRTFLQILCASLILYAPLIFWELRMSPRCHYDVYGFMQTDFQMTLRGGGYRPMVFMNGGLALAMFVLSAGVAALALYRSKERIPVPGIAKLRAGPVSSFFALLVVLMKSTGAIVYAVVCMPLLAFMRKPRMRLALFLAILVLA